MNMFTGRKLLIATKHGKEKVMAPLLEKALGVNCCVATDFDTDKLGTFSGEIERGDDALVTVKNKCLQAMELYGCDLAIANEGSFGPHPTIFFAHADDEIVYLLDKKNELEIFVRVVTTDTNFNAETITDKSALKDFAAKAKFSSHALIIKSSKNDLQGMKKGIQDWQTLVESFEALQQKYGSAYVETDMRAHYNPTRMQVIEKATEKLVAKIQSTCPQCQTPGLGITAVKEGLPCSACKQPTASILSYIYECQKCTFMKEEKYPHEKLVEEPMYCNYCNP